MRTLHQAAMITLVYVLVISAVSMADIARTADPSFVTVVDWSFVAVIAGFGMIGSLARINPQRRDQAVLALLLGGLVAGLGMGLMLAEVDYFHERPLGLLGFCVLAGYTGTVALDVFAARTIESVRRSIEQAITPKGRPPDAPP